jgi:D-amino-acid dehydrogenase
MEINGMERHINMKRVNGIVKTLPVYFPELAPVTPPEAEVWNGLRPCSPD